MRQIKLIDTKFQIEFEYLIADFKLMSELVKWCDSYSRFSILHFDMLKDFVNYSLFFERNTSLPSYIKKIKVYVRHTKYVNKKIKEFKDFILKKFKKAEPKIKKWLEDKDAIQTRT